MPRNDPPLADLLEHAIRGSGLHDRARVDDGTPAGAPCAAEPNFLHERLIEELTTAQEQMRAEPSALYAEQAPDYEQLLVEHIVLEEPPVPPFILTTQEVAPLSDMISEAIAENAIQTGPSAAPAEEAAGAQEATAPVFQQASQTSKGAVSDRAGAFSQKARKIARWMRMREWSRRRLAVLSAVHRHVFDRSTEQLLFCKTPPLDVYHIEETEKGPEKFFFYQGPIPKMLLDWALSAMPEELKRYAFVDFRAGNGRTLLLAARRNFEYAAGYAYDAEGSETLEMNLAQYPRTYLTCRDVRALRGDRDGVVIPSQPAVLFFPDSLSAGHLDIILSYVSASLQLEPRPIYLIFENAGRERGREQMSLFERVPLPLVNRAKAFVFAPVSIAVYRSGIEISD